MPRALFVLTLFIAGGTSLKAQQADSRSRFDIAAGVSFNGPADVNQRPKCSELGLPCTSGKEFPDAGLVLQGTARLARNLAVVVEGSVYGNTWDSVATQKVRTNHVSALLVGPRLMTSTHALHWYKDTTRFRAFAHVLGGPEASTILPTRFAVQPGFGLDGKLAWPSAWIRLEYDYRSTHGSPRNLSGGRGLCALVFDVPDR